MLQLISLNLIFQKEGDKMVNGFNFGVGLSMMFIANSLMINFHNSQDFTTLFLIILLFYCGVVNFYLAFKEKKK